MLHLQKFGEIYGAASLPLNISQKLEINTHHYLCKMVLQPSVLEPVHIIVSTVIIVYLPKLC